MISDKAGSMTEPIEILRALSKALGEVAKAIEPDYGDFDQSAFLKLMLLIAASVTEETADTMEHLATEGVK